MLPSAFQHPVQRKKSPSTHETAKDVFANVPKNTTHKRQAHLRSRLWGIESFFSAVRSAFWHAITTSLQRNAGGSRKTICKSRGTGDCLPLARLNDPCRPAQEKNACAIRLCVKLWLTAPEFPDPDASHLCDFFGKNRVPGTRWSFSLCHLLVTPFWVPGSDCSYAYD